MPDNEAEAKNLRGKGKPKSTAELIKLLEERAAAEGKTFSYGIDDAGKVQTDDPDAQKIADAAVRKDGFNKLEIELDSDEIDTFKCGACQAVLSSAVDKCPDCGADLQW